MYRIDKIVCMDLKSVDPTLPYSRSRLNTIQEEIVKNSFMPRSRDRHFYFSLPIFEGLRAAGISEYILNNGSEKVPVLTLLNSRVSLKYFLLTQHNRISHLSVAVCDLLTGGFSL